MPTIFATSRSTSGTPKNEGGLLLRIVGFVADLSAPGCEKPKRGDSHILTGKIGLTITTNYSAALVGEKSLCFPSGSCLDQKSGHGHVVFGNTVERAQRLWEKIAE